jgi:MscS family membrane protein
MPMRCLLTIVAMLVCTCGSVWAQNELQGPNPLEPVKTDSPQDTMKTYLDAMNDYLRGKASGDKVLLDRLDDAARCFHLKGLTLTARRDSGEEAAILLKEVIDRIIKVDLEKVPGADEVGSGDGALQRWRLRMTEITIVKVVEGDRAGEFLFSTNTVERLPSFYARVKHLPYLPGLKGGGYAEPWMATGLPDWATRKVVFFPNWQWIGLFGAILIGLILRTVASYLIGLSKKVTSKTRHQWDNEIMIAVERPSGVVVAGVFWLFAIHALRFEGNVLAIFNIAVQVVIGVGCIWAFYRLADVAAEYMAELTSRTESTLDDQLVPLIRKSLKVFVVVFGVLVVIQNMGVNVLSLLAGLGLGGLAFALAARDTCANLFGSIMILLDRPFQIGDWVIIGSLEGTVEEIGFRSTRIRTFYDSLISVPNATVANANIDNMGSRRHRRIKAFFGVTYDTDPEKLEAFLEGVKNIVKASPHTRKNGYHVVLNSYQDSCLSVMLYCFLEVPDWSHELIAKQNIYLEIHRLAHKLEVEFAFPTQTLHVASTPESPMIESNTERDELMATAAAFGVGGAMAAPTGHGIFTAPFQEKVATETLRGEADN